MRHLILGLCLLIPTLVSAATIGAYADPAAEGSFAGPRIGGPDFVLVDAYIVVRVEDLVDAVGFRVDINGLGTSAFIVQALFGPDGRGLGFDSDGGEIVGLGGCFPGFNATNILVTHYEIALFDTWPVSGALPRGPIPSRLMTLYPNPDADPGNVDAQLFPVYSNCRGDIQPLVVTSELFAYVRVPTEAYSFGAVKALAMPAN